MYLLDTNVVSEFRQDEPAPGVVRFLAEVTPEQTCLSVITLMELHRGVSMLPLGKRRSDIEDWINRTLVPRYAGRILVVDQETAFFCGRLLGDRRLTPEIRRIMDFWLAATALQHDLAVVTRNERDFRDLGIRIVNPWAV